MQVVKLSSIEKNIVNTNISLSSYLKALETGRKATPQSWLYEKKSPDAILNAWIDILESGQKTEEMEAILSFDLAQREKFGPQGEVPPIKDLMPIISDAFAYPTFQPNAIFSSPQWIEAKRRVIDHLQFRHQLRPSSYSSVLAQMHDKSSDVTNSGWPDFTKRNVASTQANAIAAAESGKWKEYPFIILFRSYLKKMRMVWMAPLAVNLVELSFHNPLLAYVRDKDAFFSPYAGFNAVEQTTTEEWQPHLFAFGGDVTAMDAHFTRDKTLEVYDVIKHAFQEKYHQLLYESLQYINSADLIIGRDKKIIGQHGLASGSGWTNFAETMFQYIIYHYQVVLAEQNLFPTPEGMMSIGDDQIVFYNFENGVTDSGKVAQLSASLYTDLGLPANPAKQSATEGRVTFLQRLFLRNYYSRENSKILGGVYPTVRALNSLVNPERFHDPRHWSSEMFCVRVAMIVENTVNHPKFEEFCEFVGKGQKDIIPFFQKLPPSELDAWWRKSRAIPGLNPTYNQEKLDKPLSSFACVRYWKGGSVER